MADDGWTTVGAPKKKTTTSAAPKKTGLSPIPTKTVATTSTFAKSSSASSGPKKYAATSAFTGSTSSSVQQKYGAGTNKKNVGGPSARKIEEEAEYGEGSLAAKKIDHTISENIMRARNAKGWTQKDLAREVHESPNVIRDYENGKATPNGMVITKMEKALGTKLK